MGLTFVCSNLAAVARDDMIEVCPAGVKAGPAQNPNPQQARTKRVTEGCSCLPIQVVKQDLESGISPLGIGQNCVKLEPELVFPNLEG